MAAGTGPGGKAGPGGKPDPKKDAKAPVKKGGAAAVEDKNAPKVITIEYPEVPSGETFVIVEKDYRQMKNVMVKNEKDIQ